MAKKESWVTYNGKWHDNRGDVNMMVFLRLGEAYRVVETIMNWKWNCTLYTLKSFLGINSMQSASTKLRDCKSVPFSYTLPYSFIYLFI